MRKGPPTAVRGTPTSIYSGESKRDSCGGQSRWHHSTCRVKKKKWRIHLFSLHKVRSRWMRDESWSERKFERKEELMQLKFEYVQCFVIVLPNVTQLFSPWNGPMALFIKPSIKQSISTSCPPVQTMSESSVSWPHVPASDDEVAVDEGETETESEDCSQREREGGVGVGWGVTQRKRNTTCTWQVCLQ